MATQDNSPGLFSKVAKFVRNPATDWAEVGKVDQADSGDQSKQSLKRMIERKAHNDAVRKREFSQLRKLRRAAPDKLADMAARTSFFKDSSVDSALDERAKTLKKIDDIEAQMSKQWWKGRPTSDATAPVAVPAGALPASLAVDSGFASTLASDLHDSSDDVLTQMGAHAEADVLSSGRDLKAAAGKAARGFDQTGSSAFSPSKVESIDMGLMLSDPVLEEAAIRFANSDDAGAEAVLQAALQNADVTPESADGWASALFDMYRGTGQQISFEWLAMDYERRFGRRCPVWFSTPQVLGLNLVPDGPPELPRTPGGQLHWICPADIDLAAVQQLQAQVVLAGGPYRLDWQAAKRIAPQAAQALASLFERWCDQPYTLSFEGVQPLERLLRAHTPVGENRTAAFWWKLRLDTLRILRQQEEYEVVAMDYCVTYEVSPPPWQPARCQRAYGPHATTQNLTAEDGPGDSYIGHTLYAQPEAQTARQALEQPDDLQFEFAGEVLGDAASVLQTLQSTAGQGQAVVISCERLIRVDFSAAGSLLNWFANAQQSGSSIELRDVPRLVAAFFNLIGINEHVRILVRQN